MNDALIDFVTLWMGRQHIPTSNKVLMLPATFYAAYANEKGVKQAYRYAKDSLEIDNLFDYDIIAMPIFDND